MMYEDKRDWDFNLDLYNYRALARMIREADTSHLHRSLTALFYDFKLYRANPPEGKTMQVDWVKSVIGDEAYPMAKIVMHTVMKHYRDLMESYSGCSVGKWRKNFNTVQKCHHNNILRQWMLTIYLYQHYYLGVQP